MIFARLDGRERPALLLQTSLHVRERVAFGSKAGIEQGRAQRKPLLLFSLEGLFLLRLAARRLFSLLFHEPPRTTRALRRPHIKRDHSRAMPLSWSCCLQPATQQAAELRRLLRRVTELRR